MSNIMASKRQNLLCSTIVYAIIATDSSLIHEILYYHTIASRTTPCLGDVGTMIPSNLEGLTMERLNAV